MNVKQSFLMAIRNLCVNKVHFFQATLGMAIGIAGFILALCSGIMSSSAIQVTGDEYDSALLKTKVYISKNSPIQFRYEDILQLAEKNPEVIKGITPYVEFEFNGGVRYGERTNDKAWLYGVNGSYLDMMPVLTLQEGRFISDIDIDRERKVCVIGSSLANDMIGGDALGKEIKIWGENYTVIGVFAEVPNESRPKRNVEVCIPYTNALKTLGDEALKAIGDSVTSRDWYTYSYLACANGTENMYDMQVLIKERLKERTGKDEENGWAVGTTNMVAIMGRLSDWVLASAIQMALLSGIILLVGGVGIMNVMLASVQARTKEIGIRKAFGATNRDIQRQFTLESVITGLVGCFLGVPIGFAIIFGICVYGNIPLSYLSGIGWPVLLAVVVSVGVGVVFGTYPAKQAAKLEIVEALNEG